MNSIECHLNNSILCDKRSMYLLLLTSKQTAYLYNFMPVLLEKSGTHC